MPESFKDKVRAVYNKYIQDCKSAFGEAFTVEPLSFIDDVRRIEVGTVDPFRLLRLGRIIWVTSNNLHQ